MARSVYEFSYKERKKLRNTILFFVGLFLLIVGLNTLIFKFLLFPVVVKSDSMLPRVDQGGLLLASPIGSVERGSPVVLKPQMKKKLGGNLILPSVLFSRCRIFNVGQMPSQLVTCYVVWWDYQGIPST